MHIKKSKHNCHIKRSKERVMIMIKVVRKYWDEFKEGYSLFLEDEDIVFIPETEYDKIQTHTSANGKKLKAVVNEHEGNDSEPIEYLGFELVE